MSSEIRVNSLSSRAGLSTVTFTDTGPIFSGITTFQDNSGFNVGTGGSIFSPASNIVTLGTNNAERFRITSGGDVGIGDNAPNSSYGTNLSVHSTATDGARLKLSDGTTGKGNTDGFDLISTGGVAYILNRENADMSFSTNNAERLRIASDGKISITGSTANMEYLRMGGNNGRGLRFTSSSGSSSVGVVHTINAPGDNGAQGAIVLQTNSAERLRITSDGNIGVGVANPSQKFMVKGIIASEATNSTNNWMAYTYTDNTFRLNYNGAGDDEVIVTSGGNVSVGGAAGRDFSLLDGIVTNTANGSAGLLINSSSSSHNAYLGFSYGSGSSTSHADQFSAYIGRVGDNTLILGTDNNIRVRIDPSGHLLHGVAADEDTSGNGGLRFINSGDIQIDGDQKALVFRSTNNTAQLQSAIEWWNENGAGVQSKIACDRTAVSQAPSDLVFYTSSNVDLGGAGNDGAIAEHLRITSAGETLISNNANRFLSLDRTNATSGSGEFNLNVEINSQATVSYDDGAPLVMGTCSSPRTQAGFTERFRISPEGYVTKPNHPSFRVGRHTDYSHTGGQPVQFNYTSGSAHLNRGNHYNTSNHRFVAPVAGVYQFSACIIVNGLANPTDVTDLFYLYKNGSHVAYSMRRARYVGNYTGTAGYYVDFLSNVNVLMAANDYCDIRVRLSLSVHGNASYSWFSGTLVG